LKSKSILYKDNLKPLFPLSEGQPFLSRGFQAVELSIADHFEVFCRSQRGAEVPPMSKIGNGFFSYMSAKGIAAKHLRQYKDRPPTYFQGVYRRFPAGAALSVLGRMYGFAVKLTDEEVRDAFREIVDHHRGEQGSLPKWNDIEKYYISRFFLPNTGILLPGSETFRKRSRIDGEEGLVAAYQTFYPDLGLSEQELVGLTRSKRVVRFTDLYQHYKKVNDWLHKIDPFLPKERLPTKEDMVRYTRLNGGISYGLYDKWIKGNSDIIVTGMPEGQVASLDLFGKMLGVDRKLVLHRNKLVFSLGVNTKTMRERMLAAWAHLNPRGYNPKVGILVGPPDLDSYGWLVRRQTSMLNALGVLDPEKCRELNLPSLELPSKSSIQNYDGMGHVALLGDIERDVCLSKGRTIVFQNGQSRLVADLANQAVRNNVPHDRIPVVVRQALGRSLER